MRIAMTLFLVLFVATAIVALPQQGAAQSSTMSKAPKMDRVSGTIVRSNKEKSMLVVSENRSKIEKTVYYSADTKWTSKNAPAEMKDFKDGARVICVGTFTEKGDLTAARIDLQ